MTHFMLKVQLEIPQLPHNLFGPNQPIIWDFFEKNPHHMSIVHGCSNSKQRINRVVSCQGFKRQRFVSLTNYTLTQGPLE